MRPLLILLALALAALQVAAQDLTLPDEAPLEKSAAAAEETADPAAAGDGAVNTRAGPQSAAAPGGQDLRFSPALIGSVLNAGSALIHSALTGGGRGSGHHSHQGGNFGHGGHGGDFGHSGHGGHGGNHPGFNQFGHGGFGGSNFGGGGFGGGRPNRPGGFGGRRPNRPGFGHHGHQSFGGHQGGFGHQAGFGNQGGFGHHGGFNQGGFGHSGGFGNQGGFGHQSGFGGEKGGSCPPVRAECPLRSFGPPNPCVNDFGCTAADKCCFDVCLKEKVCKAPENHHG